MAIRCAKCSSRDTMANVHEYVCLECGSLTRTDGSLVPKDEQFGSEDQEDN